MATAAKCVIVEAEEIVEEGELDPNNIHVSGVYVDKVIKAELLEKRIEKLTLSEENVKRKNYL
jgi:acyl CoA:acetate/3-ketoacid CoA transferase